MKSDPNRKKTPAVPARANSSQAAARTMFCVTTTMMAESPVMAAMIQNKNCANDITTSDRLRPGQYAGHRGGFRGPTRDSRRRHAASGPGLERTSQGQQNHAGGGSNRPHDADDGGHE